MTPAQHPPERPGNQAELLVGGQNYFPAVLAALQSATREIRVETYIFANDEVGMAVCKALCDASLRGVHVRVVIDGFGGQEGVEHHVPALRRAGVHVRVFRPERSKLRLSASRLRRLHRKLIAVDRQLAFVGGINLIDDLNHEDEQHELRMAELREHQAYVHILAGAAGLSQRVQEARVEGEPMGPRYDFAVRLQGPVVQDVWNAMQWLWWQVGPRGKVTDTFTARWWRLRRERLARFLAEDDALGPVPPAGAMRTQLVLRDNFRFRRRIERAYIQALKQAHTSVVLANAYFLPSRRLRHALYDARARGVVVQVLVQGRVEYPFQHYATQHLYDELLDHGVQVYEYMPSFLHAKVAVVDSWWATVGSSNLDPLSTLFAREANIVVQHRQFAQQLKAELLRAIEHDARVVDTDWSARRSWRARAMSWLCYKLAVLAVLITAWGSRY
ncbi:MAG: phospholipase D-like domain-containing protein [Limnobacter sp.]|uniref:phospholipase D-like domain-containing protein n=1 Tax=Limnobacter sp. TaxID=2003368 RepID=UPI00391889C6